MSNTTIGLDIGGTKVLGVVLDGDGNVLAEDRVPSPVVGLDPLVDACAGLIDALDAPGVPIGVGAAGLVDLDGKLTYAPNIAGVRDAPLRAALAQKVGRTAIVDNDANVAALGEVTYGAGRGARHALMVTLGTGVGGGLILDGAIYRGANGFAGEIGHITVRSDGPLCACGEPGHWEAIASGTALGDMARDDASVAGDTGEAVGNAAAAGDEAALRLLARYADNVAVGLVNLANTFDPELILIAGGVVELGPLLFEPLRAAFRSHLEGAAHRPEIPLEPATLGERAGAVGAAVLARQLL